MSEPDGRSSVEPSSAKPDKLGASGHLRASDTDREQVVTVLSTAYAEGRLSREEHDERLSQVMDAKTFDELIPLTHDLVVVAPATSPTAPATSPSRRYSIEPTGATTAPDHLVAIFGGVSRKGRWRVRSRAWSLALFGGVDLDLNDAIFEGQVVEISGFWCFGGLDIKVPAGVQVRDRVVGIFGGSDVRGLGDAEPGAPTLVVKGLALFGGVLIKGPKPRQPR